MPPPEPKNPTHWTPAEIEIECANAREEFRQRRLVDPRVEYETEFDSLKTAVAFVIRCLPEILGGDNPSELLAGIRADTRKFIALRYLMAPPVSEDDLDTLLDVKLSSKLLRTNPEVSTRFAALIRAGLDTRRFPWLQRGTKPSSTAINAAELATTVAAAIQRAQTKRRGDEKEQLESSVRSLLLTELTFKQIAQPKDSISLENFRDRAPRAGEFMHGATLGADNSDFVIGLWNNRLLAIECKSSNSEINSRKRLNKEVVKNAGGWTGSFGNIVVPGAVLRGVFKPQYVAAAQAKPVAIFWGHRLQDLAHFIRATERA